MTGYVNPGVLAETTWVEEHSADPDIRLVECDEDADLYDRSHIPGAVRIDWQADLNDQRVRDHVDARTFERLMGRLGITRDTTVVFYGDQANWWAAYAYWVFRIMGHPKLCLVNGGRKKWLAELRAMTSAPTLPPETRYVVAERNPGLRAFRTDVMRHIGNPSPRQLVVRLPAAHSLVDVRTPAEYSGQLVQMAGYPQEGALRGGHIPAAVNIPWGRAVNTDWTFRSAGEIRRLYEGAGITPDKDIIVYCRIGERSSLTWFVLHELMGYRRVRNYDGSWTEWGNSVGVPVANPSLVLGTRDRAATGVFPRAVAH
ncbi:MAG: sulfurtransferase [Acidobacteriia bacterium]|nr:sulfurtransferase [Terriglobia bacterium]